MKIEKKHWIIIAIVVILIALWYFFLRKKPESKYAGMYGSFGNESGFWGWDSKNKKIITDSPVTNTIKPGDTFCSGDYLYVWNGTAGVAVMSTTNTMVKCPATKSSTGKLF